MEWTVRVTYLSLGREFTHTFQIHHFSRVPFSIPLAHDRLYVEHGIRTENIKSVFLVRYCPRCDRELDQYERTCHLCNSENTNSIDEA